MEIKTRATTGLTLTTVIKRDADGFLYDWSDGTFKPTGWTTVGGALVEEVAPIPPGHYETAEIDTSTWLDGLYTAYISGVERDPIEIRIKDGDIWEALLDVAVSSRASSIGIGGASGSVVVEVTVKEDDASGVPIPLVSVDVRTSAGTFIDRTFTDTDGKAVFALDPGDYEILLSRVGVPITFTRPELLTVPEVASLAVEFYGVPFLPFVPTGPALAIVYDYLYNLGLDPRPGLDVTAKVIKPTKAYLADGPAITGVERTKTNAMGLFQLSLPRQLDFLTPDVRYRIEIDRARFVQEFDAADLDGGGAIILSSLS